MQKVKNITNVFLSGQFNTAPFVLNLDFNTLLY